MNGRKALRFLLMAAAIAFLTVRSGMVPTVGSAALDDTAAEPPTYRAAYFYVTDRAIAEGYQSWLEGEGFGVDLLPARQITVYLPLVVRGVSGGPSAARAESSPSSANAVGAASDLSTYDLILIGPDTGTGGMWGGSADLVGEISDTLKPVVALGAGGHTFLGQLGLDIGYPNGGDTMAQSAQVADPAQTDPIWNGTRTVPRTEEIADLYATAVSAFFIPLPDRLPDGVRVASLPGDPDQFPIVIQDERFILWGFGGSADAMTGAGRNLFLNLLDFGEQDLVVPLHSREFTPPPGVEEAFAEALGGAGEPLHALVQLRRPLTPADQEALEGLGVSLISYLSGLNYLGLVDPVTDVDHPELLALVRWIGEYRPEDRVHPDIVNGELAAYNISASGTLTVTVMFFPEISEGQAHETLSVYGAEIVRDGALNSWTVMMDEGAVEPLSAEEAVRWIEPGPAPARDVNDGGRVSMGTNAVVDWDTATGTARGLDGTGVRVAVSEGNAGYANRAADYRHPDFGSRFVYTYTNSYSDHTTHVSGIIGADGSESAGDGGTNAQWRGHAPGVTLISVPYAFDTEEHYHTAINTYGADLSNHSYIMEHEIYNARVAGIDSIARGDASYGGSTIPARLIVWAACNEGHTNQHTNEEGFFSIGAPAKNVLTVGSINSESSDLTHFSSRGPTFDNRLKPDVVAPGCQRNGDEGIMSTMADQFTNWYTRDCDGSGDDYCYPYDTMCGTSMAAPATAGAMALALEKYFDLYNTSTPPYPSTLKGLAIHTAVDLQRDFANPQPGQEAQFWNDPDMCSAAQALDFSTPVSPTCAVLYHAGPDYSTGYGLINVPALVEQVQHRGFVQGNVSPTDTTDTYTVTVLANRPEIQFTLVWDDEPGDTATAETTAKLVNDLDLTLIDPDGVVYHPWILDPLNPTANPGNGGFDPVTRADITAARRAVDRRNNVEQVTVTDAVGVKTGTWTVRVRADTLGNLNAQRYSLIGDFRRVNIVGGQTLLSTGFPVSAGPPTNPDEVLLRVKIENPHVTPGHTQNYTTTDFLVDVGDPDGGVAWQSANVLSVFQVGGEVAIDIRPPTGLSAGTDYDVRVTLVGIDDDIQSNAIRFVEGDQVAGYFLTDASGSMRGGKIEAAMEAGKALVDLLRVDDWVGVGVFTTTVGHRMDVIQVTGDPELTTAKGYINTFTAGGATAMGPGMNTARKKLDAASLPGDTQEIVFLLSDGMENTADPEWASPPTVGCWDNHPDWDCEDNPPYVKTSWPADIQAYVVCIGEAGAAWHTFCDQVGTDTGGPSVWHVYETPATAGTTSWSQLDLPQSVAPPRSETVTSPAAAAGSIFDHPTTLPLRLSDAYLDMGQKSHRWPRMLEWTGWISRELELVRIPLDVEEELPAMYVTVEWDHPGAPVEAELERPDGSLVDPADGDVIFYRRDDTHVHWGIERPKPDRWYVRAMALKETAEVLVTVSGPSDISMRLLVDPDDQFVYEEIKICALLNDNRPIPPSSPAYAVANVIDPAGNPSWMELFDDGYHEDGAANNGVFCARYTGVALPGVYQIKAMGWGDANDGRGFIRRATGFTYRKPKVLFVYREERAAEEYAKLFAMNEVMVDRIPVDELKPGRPDLSQYALIVIGPETGYREDWGDGDAIEALIASRRPTLGLGEGGYAFYGKLNLDIGYPHGMHGKDRDVYAVDMGHDIWQLPHDLKLLAREERLYGRTEHVGIYVTELPWGAELLGREVDSRSHYPIIRQVTWDFQDAPWNHCLWGYQAGPSSMTDQGRRLFFNVAWYMMP